MPIIKSALLKTSSMNDAKRRGGVVSITGLLPFRDYDILGMRQIKYKVEVPQVVKVAYNLYTPTGFTTYTISVGAYQSTREGYAGVDKKYAYVTPAIITTLGATAALQREAIHANLIAKVNKDHAKGAVYTTAASLGAGTGITLTDDAGYYPARLNGASNGRKGASTVILVTNKDGSGWVNNTANNIVTTAAVYSWGEGQRLLNDKPVLYGITGNLSSGELQAPVTIDGLYATAGQHYDTFIISATKPSPANALIDQWALTTVDYAVFYDNGTGADTTNLAGSIAFEREMLRLLFWRHKNDPSATYDFFEAARINSSTTTGAAPAGTDNIAVASITDESLIYYNPIGTATIVAPIVTANGLPIVLDSTTQEGVEISAPILTQAPQEFIVGQVEFSLYGRINVGANIAATTYKSFAFGFRKKAAYAVDQTAYEAASVATVALGIPLNTGAAPIWNIITGPGAAGVLTNTSTVVTPAANSITEFIITVDINGVVNFFVNSVDKTPLLAATYTLTAGLHMIPFCQSVNAAAANALPFLVQWASLPTKNWRV